MITGLKFQILWRDVDVVKATISASNGEFGGITAVYIDSRGITEGASVLEGFPKTASDTRDWELGTFDPEYAGGGVRLRFFCYGGAGHSAVEIHVRSEEENRAGNHWNRPAQSVHFFAHIEANAVDDFVMQLRRIEDDQVGIALLRFAGPAS